MRNLFTDDPLDLAVVDIPSHTVSKITPLVSAKCLGKMNGELLPMLLRYGAVDGVDSCSHMARVIRRLMNAEISH